ncbi:MAG: hypothetical protein H7Y17_06340 [Chlorobia bacterium]|nr:hypothetical protein [Fimbriimonadaceae bacterium]
MSSEPGPSSRAPVGTKLAYHLDGVGQAPHRHPHLWKREPAANGERLLIGPKEGFLDLLLQLADCLEPPYAILYVLSVPRVSEPGRYQMSGRLDRQQLQEFVEPYRAYLEGDARHHLWIHSHDSTATLVYDKHDLIYAYGPLDCYLDVLEKNQLMAGQFELPFPHYHNYFPEFDETEKLIIASHEWKRTGILPGVDD